MKEIKNLLKKVKVFYKKEGRAHLPWRTTRDPYKILVSEVMLQQTQAERVIPLYKKFIKKFPTAKKLARTKLSEVLKAWQGLGYNRRAKYLWTSAKILCSGEINTTPTPLQRIFAEVKLPGVGPYTAGAIAAFAFNKPEIFIETNIRTVFMHFCFSKKKKVSDAQILPLVAEALKKSKMPPRDFYAALMDYGAFLKKRGVKLNAKSKHYAKQSKFEGSVRQLRGALLRELLKSSATPNQLTKKFSPARSRGEVERELARLAHEGLIVQARGRYRVAG